MSISNRMAIHFVGAVLPFSIGKLLAVVGGYGCGRHCESIKTRHAPFVAGMTMARGNSAPAPQRPTDCVSAMSMETNFPTVTFTRSGCITDALVRRVLVTQGHALRSV